VSLPYTTQKKESNSTLDSLEILQKLHRDDETPRPVLVFFASRIKITLHRGRKHTPAHTKEKPPKKKIKEKRW
jgi:hypothetical protein